MNDDIYDLRERVAQACRVLGTLNLTKAAIGHVSARLPGTNRAFIRARGPGELGVRYTTVEEVIEVDLDGHAIGAPPGLLAPSEVFIHTSVYRARPEVNGVVHIHPKTVVLFTICKKPLLPLYGAFDPSGLKLVLDGIPTYERSITITTPALGEDLVRAMGSKSVCLMRGHGITTASESVEEAALDAICLNDLATINYEASLLGDPEPISDEDVAYFRARTDAGRYTGGAPGVPGERAAAVWRYYTTLTVSAGAGLE
jgi:ribulose-5-phosphate 4-epimerase/fuculose-1-phosphate aldolase